jgi:hypothetical protein
MKFIAILSAGVVLCLSGCGSSDDESMPPNFPNAMARANAAAPSTSESEEEGSSSPETVSEGQYEGTSVEGMSVEPTTNPSAGSETQSADSEASADDQSAEQAADAPDGQ